RCCSGASRYGHFNSGQRKERFRQFKVLGARGGSAGETLKLSRRTRAVIGVGRGWTSAEVEEWAQPDSWHGTRGVKTLYEVRSASRSLAMSWRLDVDEVVSIVWETLQSPALGGADNKAAYLWAAVKRRV